MKERSKYSDKQKPADRRRRVQVSVVAHTVLSPDKKTISVRIPLKIAQHGGRKLVMTPDGVSAPSSKLQSVDNARIKAIARAFRWRKLLETGAYSSVEEIAKSEKINPSYVSRILRLTLLAPDIVESLIDERRTFQVELERLLKPLPSEWAAQRNELKSTRSSSR